MGGLARNADVDILELPKPRNLLDTILESGRVPGLSVKQLALQAKVPELNAHLRDIGALIQLRTEPVWVVVPHGMRLK